MLAVDGVVLLPQGALWLPAEGTLVVADLHVGYEEAARARGDALPPGPARGELVARAVQAVSGLSVTSPRSTRVQRIVVNGDVKHARAPLLAQGTAVRALDAQLRELAEVVYVRGNHDAGLEAILPHAAVVDRLQVGPWLVAHGHEPIGAGPAIVGHEHPTIVLRDPVGARVKARAFLRLADTWVLPALSPWASGVPVLARGFAGPRLAARDPRDADAYVLGEAEVLPFGRLRALARAGFA